MSDGSNHASPRLVISSSVPLLVYSTVGRFCPLGSMLRRRPLELPAAFIASAFACKEKIYSKCTMYLMMQEDYQASLTYYKTKQ